MELCRSTEWSRACTQATSEQTERPTAKVRSTIASEVQRRCSERGAFIGGEQFFDHAPFIPRRLRHFQRQNFLLCNPHESARAARLLDDENTVFVDLRDDTELAREGKIPGSLHVSRGILELALDPTLPYHNPVFSSGQELPVLLCKRRAPGAGGGHGPSVGTDKCRSFGRRGSRLESSLSSDGEMMTGPAAPLVTHRVYLTIR